MRISIIGSGNVGSHLAKKLYSLKHDIVQVFSRTLSNAQAVANLVDASAIDDLREVNGQVDVIFVSVPDDYIEDVSNRLGSVDALIVHTSGSVASTVLSKHQRFGVFYPMQTFQKDLDLSWKGVPTFLLANSDKDRDVLQSLAGQMEVQAQFIDDQQRAALHVAAVFANNYTNHMLVIAERIMRENNLDYNLLKPLIQRTFDSDKLPYTIQTGPAQRGDEQTLERQLGFLENDERYQTIYAMLAASIVEEKKRNEERDS